VYFVAAAAERLWIYFTFLWPGALFLSGHGRAICFTSRPLIHFADAEDLFPAAALMPFNPTKSSALTKSSTYSVMESTIWNDIKR
jgi:hypothetical protein